ncbi:hypothetical protein BDR04DRAFT_1138729 [Suillus decipiens]|nr:hypothetical protein BDR04DRAFT_1138729 [Suillus decipiens]
MGIAIRIGDNFSYLRARFSVAVQQGWHLGKEFWYYRKHRAFDPVEAILLDASGWIKPHRAQISMDKVASSVRCINLLGFVGSTVPKYYHHLIILLTSERNYLLSTRNYYEATVMIIGPSRRWHNGIDPRSVVTCPTMVDPAEYCAILNSKNIEKRKGPNRELNPGPPATSTPCVGDCSRSGYHTTRPLGLIGEIVIDSYNHREVINRIRGHTG